MYNTYIDFNDLRGASLDLELVYLFEREVGLSKRGGTRIDWCERAEMAYYCLLLVVREAYPTITSACCSFGCCLRKESQKERVSLRPPT